MLCGTGSPLIVVPQDAQGKCPLGSAVLMTQTEYEAVSIAPTLSEVFKMPEAADINGAWAAGFIPVMSFALVAWGVRAIVSQLKR